MLKAKDQNPGLSAGDFLLGNRCIREVGRGSRRLLLALPLVRFGGGDSIRH
jgi:hypothetical protein